MILQQNVVMQCLSTTSAKDHLLSSDASPVLRL